MAIIAIRGFYRNRNLLSARAAHNVQTLRALLSAMEALLQAPWSGKAARFMANSSTPHLWAHVRQFFLKSLMFYIFFGWSRCDGGMSSHNTLVKTFAFGPKHCMMTGGNQPTISGTREFIVSSSADDETSPCLARLAGGSISWRAHDKNERLRTRGSS